MYTIFSTDTCKWCVLAKNLMNKNNMQFTELNIPQNMSKEDFGVVVEEHGARPTVPKIFIGKRLIGGYEDLVEYIDNELGGYGEGKL